MKKIIFILFFISGIIFSNHVPYFLNFHYDSYIFGVPPSCFKGEFEVFRSKLAKEENVFYILDDINLFLKIQTLNFSEPEKLDLSIIKTLVKRGNPSNIALRLEIFNISITFAR